MAISVVLLSGYAVLMLFYFIGWKRTKGFSISDNFSPKTKVSVIVAARNEETNIGNCVNSILQQDYPKELFEVIVVDDGSEDGTLDVVKSLTPPLSEGEGVRTISLLSGTGKKHAIELGIQNSKGELIITTDADCVSNQNWLSTIVAYYEQYHPEMIAAPVAFIHENSRLEKWQSLDLCGMMAITAGAITNGFPNMCNGANLAYEKKAFEEVGGFSGIDRQPSGDDVMLMMKIVKKYPRGVHFLKSKEAIVFTQTEKTLSGLFQQRLRWLSKGTAFSDWRVSAVLVVSWFFNLSIFINLVAGFFRRELWIVAAVSFVMKTVAELPLLWSGCSFFGKKQLLRNVLPAQAVHILYVVIIGGSSKLSRYSWKGRIYPN